MNEIKQIRSLQNVLVKKILLLKEKSRERKKTGLFIVEGQREIQLAIAGNYRLETIIFQEGLVSKKTVLALLDALDTDTLEIIAVSGAVYGKIAYRETTEGILAIAKSKQHTLNQIRFTCNKPLVLVAQAPEKPGNIGALLRTADATGVDAVIIADPKTDIYNPNIIRSSVGCVFTKQIAMGSTPDVIHFLQKNKIAIYGAALTATKSYLEVDFTEASAIVVGTESTGLSPTWLSKAAQTIIIPMEGEIDSMNVSVSAAILIFEAKRQRGI